jgi:serine protease Do
LALLKYIVTGIKTLTIVGLIAFTAYPYYQKYNDISITTNVNSTVAIENRITKTNPQTGQKEEGSQVGAGVIINSQYILTVNHLINDDATSDGKNNFLVHTNDIDDKSIEADVFSVSKVKMKSGEIVDLMVLKLKTPLDGYPIPRFSCSKPVIGELVYTIGTPQGFPFMIQYGFMSRNNIPFNDDKMDGRYIVDIAIFHGNSGGPVFDSHGSVIGLADAILYWQDEFGKHPAPIAMMMSPSDMCNLMDSLNLKYRT